ncbi:EamA family transporter [bacterium]|nr:EamA family transporter [bacterium]
MQKSAATENAALFTIPALIWGSTWYAITFQLGTVDPLFSISYRFGLAGILLVIYCRVRNISLRFNGVQHGRIMLQALCLFGFNYWLTYESETLITSGLVALIFSLVIFFNIFFGRLILKNPIRKQVIFGALLGLLGTFLIFQPELVGVEASDDTLLGVLLCVGGVVVASLGNIASAFNQRQQLPVISTNAIGMLYGAGSMFLIALLSGKTPTFDPSMPYVLSLIYLAVLGSVIAFSTYLTLVGRIGPDKAAYALVIVPMIAIGISMLFEGYKLEWISAIGIMFLIAGNVFALWRSTPKTG